MHSPHSVHSVSKHIAIEHLRIGMFLEDVFDKDGILLLSANSAIQNDEQIARLRARGVRSVFVNVEKGDSADDVPEIGGKRPEPMRPPDAHKTTTLDRETAYYMELDQAREIQQRTLEIAKKALKAIRNNQSFSVREAREAAEAIVGSVLRNPDALVSLCQIKGYDEYTYTHSVNVGILVSSLAQELGYRGERLVEAGMGGLLHDIGKMRVPEYILNKPGKYTDIEFKVMKRHPTYGVQLIEGKKGISPLTRAAIEQHHERFDGSGYARGLKGDEIEEIGVICAVADVYDALTSDRVYRAAWTPQKALAMIFQGRDKEYSKKIVELFTAHLGIYPVGSFVKLVGGQMGIVVRVERGKLLAPRVLVLFDESGRRLGEPFELNLAACKGAENGKKIQMSLNPKAFRVNVAEYLQSSGGQGFSA